MNAKSQGMESTNTNMKQFLETKTQTIFICKLHKYAAAIGTEGEREREREREYLLSEEPPFWLRKDLKSGELTS